MMAPFVTRYLNGSAASTFLAARARRTSPSAEYSISLPVRVHRWARGVDVVGKDASDRTHTSREFRQIRTALRLLQLSSPLSSEPYVLCCQSRLGVRRRSRRLPTGECTRRCFAPSWAVICCHQSRVVQ